MTERWFENLFGFREDGYERTRANFEINGETLHSKVNRQSYAIGTLETPSLAELRQRAAAGPHGALRVSHIAADVGVLHREPSNRHALFQVASQFNLEMTGPDITPEHGVTRYVHDLTQGPACALAAGAATVYRNYFALLAGNVGQTHDRQIDCLSDLGRALGNETNALWQMRNGYALCTERGLAAIDRLLHELDGRAGRKVGQYAAQKVGHLRAVHSTWF